MKTLPLHFDFDYITTLHYYNSVLKAAAAAGPEKVNETRRRLGETDLFFLQVNILKRKDLYHEWLFARCREVQRAPDGRLDLWAREHYKSTIITFGMTILDIINDPEITIGIFSFTKKIARDFLAQIKREFETNTDLHLLWPEIFYEEPAKQSPMWSIDGGIIVKRVGNPKEATVEGHGLIDGMPTGRHFGLRVYDDVVTLDGVNTPELIAKTTKAFQMSDNLGAKGGRARYIGTRYHLFDTYSVMIDDGVAIQRIHAATDNGREYGEPVLLTREELQEKRKKQGIYIFSSQMLLNPIADTSMGFDLRWVDKSDTDYNAAMQQLWRCIIVDPSGGKDRKKDKDGAKNKESDYTSIFVIGYGRDKKYRVLEMRRDRMSLTVRCNTLMELHLKWKPGLVAYEEYGMQADIEHIKYVQKQKLYEFEITALGGQMRKELRILRLVPLFENGFKPVDQGGDGMSKSRIVLPTTMVIKDHLGQSRDLVKDFLTEEYVAFPVLKHDDMLDCLSRLIDLEQMGLITEPGIAPAPLHSTVVEEALRRISQKEGGESAWTA